MAEYLKAEERRARVRGAAVRILQRGEIGLTLTLRHVAQEMDVALSTLTYVYPSSTALWDDLLEEHERIMWGAMIADVGDGGLEVELRKALRRYFIYAMGDRARRCFLLYGVQKIAKGDGGFIPRAGVLVDLRTGKSMLIEAIKERGHEHYRVDDAVLSWMLRSSTEGALLYWTQTGSDVLYWAITNAMVDALVMLADPQPEGTPHLAPPPQDYWSLEVPDRDKEWSPRFYAYPSDSGELGPA